MDASRLALGLAALLSLPLCATAARTPPDEGQGTARPGSRIEELSPGQAVFGAPFDPAAALGKVVVVELGGS